MFEEFDSIIAILALLASLGYPLWVLTFTALLYLVLLISND